MMYRYDNEYEEKKTGRASFWLKLLCVGLVGVLVGSTAAFGVLSAKTDKQLNAAQGQIDQLRQELARIASAEGKSSFAAQLEQTAKHNTLVDAADSNEPVVAIANACQPSIVGVTTMVDQSKLYGNYGNFGSYGSLFDFFFGFGQNGGQNNGQNSDQPENQEPNYVDYSFGSGVILSEDGYLVTNHHVIENGEKFRVTLSDGTEREATLLGSDEYSDIALLKIDDLSDLTLVPAAIGDSEKVQVGEMVVAIGNPLGVELMGTLTMGVVSATNREIDLEDGRTMETIQTDAAINSGNSGGGLFNAKGELIGITTMKISGSSYSSSASVEGLGFAIPINEALSIVDSLKETGKVERPTLGISAANFTQAYADQYNLEVGIYVNEVVAGSAADKAGLQRMDIITHFNGTRIETKEELQNQLNKTSFGDTVTLTVIRDTKTMEIKVTFEKPSDPIL